MGREENPPMDRGLFGRWLDVTLDNKDVQGKSLADSLGVTSGAVSRWRNGQSIPSPENLRDLAEYLGADPARVMATAGVPGMQESGIAPYPIPRAEARREKAREELKNLKRLSREERQYIIEAYDGFVRNKGKAVSPEEEPEEETA